MAAIITTGTLTAGNSRTFALAPGSALTLTLLPNCRVRVTETPETVSASDVGGNSPRTQNHQLAGVFTYGPYVMGGSVVVDNASNSGSTVTWGRKDTTVSTSSDGLSLMSGDGNRTLPRDAAFTVSVPLNSFATDMGSYVVAGALAFTVAAGAVVGNSATVDLVADGVNTPTFSGMYPTNGSASYLNVAGAINSITFYRASGVTWYSITNNAVVVSGTYLVPITLLAQQNISVVGGGVYAATAGGTGNTASFTIDRSLPAGADGWIEATFDTGGDVAFTLGLDASGTNSAALLEGNNDYSVRCSLAGLLSVGANTTPATTGVTVSAASSQRTRLRRASGVITLEYSSDSGATWTLVYTWPGTDSSLLYAHFYTTYSTTAKRIVAPKTAGFVPS